MFFNDKSRQFDAFWVDYGKTHQKMIFLLTQTSNINDNSLSLLPHIKSKRRVCFRHKKRGEIFSLELFSFLSVIALMLRLLS